MDTTVSRQEERNKKRGMMLSIFIHTGIILLALLPLLTYPDPPPGQEGILVNLGLPDMGEGEENAPPAAAEAPEPAEPQEEVSEPEVSQPETRPEPKPETRPEPVRERETVTTEDPSEVALREKRRKEQAEAERRQKEQQERERREREAREQAEAQQRAKEAEAQRLKDMLSGGLSGSGEGKGNTGTPGNQGDPGGDPNSDILEGISTGSGRVGGGLGSRGVMRSPTVTDNSQDRGTVVVYVCVDAAGSITEARVTQRGTTATSKRLIDKAVANARQWKFSKGDADKQCGTITYNFKVQ